MSKLIDCSDCNGRGDKGWPPRECRRCKGMGNVFAPRPTVPAASCCGEPRVSRLVDVCCDHAKLCLACCDNPVANEGDECPWCLNG